MLSSRADWVFGLARLISSPRTMLAKMAPGLNSKSPRSWLYTFTPVTSVGRRSGVNWIRRNEQSMDLAMDLASMVFPTPGTSSINRWPSATRQTRASRTSCSLPWITCLMLSATCEKEEAKRSQSPASLRATTTPPGSARSAILSSKYEKQPVTVSLRAEDHPAAGPSPSRRPSPVKGFPCGSTQRRNQPEEKEGRRYHSVPVA